MHNVIVNLSIMYAIKFIIYISFDISDAPGPPVINKFTPDVLAFNVTWNTTRDKGGSRILDYKITLLDVDKNLLQQHDGIKETYFTLRNLQQNRTYIFILQARNIGGYGESANASVTTFEAGKENVFYIQSVSHLFNQSVSQSVSQSASQSVS